EVREEFKVFALQSRHDVEGLRERLNDKLAALYDMRREINKQPPRPVATPKEKDLLKKAVGAPTSLSPPKPNLRTDAPGAQTSRPTIAAPIAVVQSAERTSTEPRSAAPVFIAPTISAERRSTESRSADAASPKLIAELLKSDQPSIGDAVPSSV